MHTTELIDAMCMTWRHDFDLVVPEPQYLDQERKLIRTAGMTEDEREGLRMMMRQLLDHHGASIAALYHMNVRQRCAAAGIAYSTYCARRKAGMSIEEALAAPVATNRSNPARQRALAAKDRFYIADKACTCGSFVRYASSGNCVPCNKSKPRKRARTAGVPVSH